MKWRNSLWSYEAVCWSPVRLVLLVTKLCQGILVTVTIQGPLVVLDEADWLLFSNRGIEIP